jgi:putative endonuclease
VQRAAGHLESEGLRVLDRNWRCDVGKIDIVAADKRTLVVCEVRVRSGRRQQAPSGAMSQAKRRRLRRLAILWLVAHGTLFDEVRVDVACLTRDRSGAFSVEYVRGVG